MEFKHWFSRTENKDQSTLWTGIVCFVLVLIQACNSTNSSLMTADSSAPMNEPVKFDLSQDK